MALNMHDSCTIMLSSAYVLVIGRTDWQPQYVMRLRCWAISMSRCRPARTTNILATATVCSVCVLCRQSVQRCLHALNCYGLQKVLSCLSSSLGGSQPIPHSTLEEVQSSRGMLVVTMGWTWGGLHLSSQQFRGTGSPADHHHSWYHVRLLRPQFWDDNVWVSQGFG